MVKFAVVLGVLAGVIYYEFMRLAMMVGEAEVARIDSLFKAAGLN